MGKLDAINTSQPTDVEAVALGAQRMREMRDATVNSFGEEHQLTGPHKFPQGVTGARPASGNSNGRLFINTARRVIEQVLGNQWVVLPTVKPVYSFTSGLATLTGTYQDLAAINVDVPLGANLFLIGFCQLSGVAGSTITTRIAVNGVEMSEPGPMTVFSEPVALGVAVVHPFIYSAGFGLSAGNCAIQFQGLGSGSAGQRFLGVLVL
jgi:hypothetical protein